MRYLELNYREKTYTSNNEIHDILLKEGFYWLIDSEIENAKLEIKNNTLIWENGSFYTGEWHYGIFKNGSFYGNWKNGIWKNGYFNGNWISGIKLN